MTVRVAVFVPVPDALMMISVVLVCLQSHRLVDEVEETGP